MRVDRITPPCCVYPCDGLASLPFRQPVNTSPTGDNGRTDGPRVDKVSGDYASTVHVDIIPPSRRQHISAITLPVNPQRTMDPNDLLCYYIGLPIIGVLYRGRINIPTIISL